MSNLPVFEMFYSLQGEGKNVGMAAYFIRLAGCNVGCSFCDEKKAWQTNNSKQMSIESIIKEIKKTNAQNVIITGGEPTMYDLTELTKEIHDLGIKTFIETSGVNEITGYWDWITLSPKQNAFPLESSLIKADEIKVVIAKEEDFLFAERMKQRKTDLSAAQKSNISFYLQPEYSQMHKILPSIVEYIQQNPNWRLSLQMHKMINVK